MNFTEQEKTICLGKNKIYINNNPQVTLSSEFKAELALQISKIVDKTFKSDIEAEKVIATAIGLPNRGKILARMVDENDSLQAFVAGQFLNIDGTPVLFDGVSVFHFSTVHSLSSDFGATAVILIRAIMDELPFKPNYVSGFTQSPRVYELLAKFSTLHPSIVISHEALRVHQKVSKFLGRPGEVVFRGKTKDCYYSSRPTSKNEAVNQWWYRDLGVIPENGDLVLLVGKLNTQIGKQ